MLYETPLPRIGALPRSSEEMIDVPVGLRAFAQQAHLRDDIKMLAHIVYRGARPQSAGDYRFIYESIRRTIGLAQRAQRDQDPGQDAECVDELGGEE